MVKTLEKCARMRAHYLLQWALVALGWLATPRSHLSAAQSEAAAPSAALAAEEKEACTRNLKVIYDAIQAYQFDHKDLPNWLSDLVPDYLTGGNVLICPVCRRTGQTESPPLADPKLACSYIFEFCPAPVGSPARGELHHTRREWKRRQMGLVGSAVPMVRCRHHNPMLNLGFNGTIYESPSQWELLFTNRVRTAELCLRAIFGGSVLEEDTPAAISSLPVRVDSPKAKHFVDLSNCYTSTLAQAWQGKEGDDLASLPQGPQKFGGVDFSIRGIIQLKGQSSDLSKFPEQVKSIPVHQHCQHLYFLHAASVGGSVEEGEQIGSYLVHLPNSEMTFEIPIYYGRSVRDWHLQSSEPDTESELKTVWTGQNKAGKRIRLFMTAWNLAPGVDIDSLDFVSSGRNAAPLLVAVSFD